MDANLDLFH